MIIADHGRHGVTLIALGDKAPSIAASAFIAPGCVIVGDVTIGEDASIWYNCVLRADVSRIVIGARTFATFPLLNPFFNYSNMRVVKQDQAVVESSFPVEVPPPAHEISVRTDQVPLHFRKYYYETLKPSTVPPRPMWAPRCGQCASSSAGAPDVSRKSTRSRPK